ncbi:MAG: carbohydrate ABC transporter permease [Solirubrobacteraceae bacterium]|nr:carbohydrate ABC transporter permease [Solirubrobacteraceae bacterium]
MTLFRYTRWSLAREIAFVAGALVFCIPLYLLAVISLKGPNEALVSPLSLPDDLQFDNYRQAAESQPVPMLDAMVNSAVITAVTVVLLIVFGSLCAYAIARHRTRLNTALYYLFVIGIILPHQAAILPLFSALHDLGLTGTRVGVILVYTGFMMPLTVFLYAGFMRGVPREYEEAAEVDGASPMRLYWRVVFPLVRPVTWTVAILTGLFVWNDLFVSLVFLSGTQDATLPVALYSFAEVSLGQWQLVFAAVGIAILPAIVFYLLAQRRIVAGFAGGIKG